MTLKEKVGQHLTDRKEFYIRVGIGVGVAGITALIMRGVASQPISRDVIVTAGSSVTGTRNRVVTNNVFLISSNRQGPPSWVVRCLETGAFFTSQRAAALAMDISETNISKQLNGLQENAQGFHFERLAMAA